MSLDMARSSSCATHLQIGQRSGTGDATGFDCETDGKFKVADTVFKEGRVRNYTPAQWEAALYKARQRTKAGEWPVIKRDDF